MADTLSDIDAFPLRHRQDARIAEKQSRPWPRFVLALAFILAATTARAVTPLADAPVFAISQAPGNVALTLSVEFPTVVSVAYIDRTYHASGSDYLGYFDPNKCYIYNSSASDSTLAPSNTPANYSYFVPNGPATAHTCAGKWSGHFLNWASMQTIDPFRWVLTGGYRVVDTATTTVVEKAWGTGQGGTGNFPDGTLQTADIAGATPFSPLIARGATTLQFRIAGQGNQMRFFVGAPALLYNVSYFNCTNFSCAAMTVGSPTVTDFSALYATTATNFGARYTTTVTVPQSGAYYFGMVADDSGAIYLNGSSTPIVAANYGNSVVTGTPVKSTSPITLTAGDTLSIRVDYVQYTGGVALQLFWQLPGSNGLTPLGPPGGNLNNGYLDYAGGTIAPNTSYNLFVRASLCDSSSGAGGLEANCVAYPQGYKPQGLIQSYSNKLRFSAFGYLNDGTLTRDAGVLRARQKFVGPTQPVPGAPAVTNAAGASVGQITAAEWDGTSGIFTPNPDATDASATNTSFGTSVATSGVMNYLNKFGEITHGDDKTYDPVSELYYAAVRYYKNLGNVPQWSDMAGLSAYDANRLSDGFPVITSWGDPILYSCQKNFILGIGDVNTWADKNVPGNSNTSNEPTIPPLVAADTSVDAVAATNKVGVLEGLGASLGTQSPYGSCCTSNSALMAGLAYDSHVNDIRPDLPSPSGAAKQRADFSTIDTYWVDVQEAQVYQNNNQFYLAAKYGGFKVPDTYKYGDPLGTPSSNVSSWHNNPYTNGSNPQPDHYYSGGSPDLMKSGLTAAFADIAASTKPVSTAFSTALGQVGTSGNASYASKYEAAGWTGDITASVLSFASTGAPTATPAWTLASLLRTQLITSTGWDLNRRMITWNGSAGAPFRPSTITSTQLAALNPSYASSNGTNLLNYLRGDQSNEQSATANKPFRARTQLLGDVVDSKVLVVGPPAFPYLDATNPGYSAFKSSSSSGYGGRPSVIYFGANDGMLHAITADLNPLPGGTGGNELFAYVPSVLFQGPNSTPNVDGLASLGNPSFTHHFLVDASPAQYDVDFSRVAGAVGGSADWHTVLIGGLGKGGRSYYALDVTDSAAMVSAAAAASNSAADTLKEQTLASKVLWEFSAGPSVPLGFTFGDPVVAKTRKYGWVVVLPSGYNTSDGIGRLFLVNPKTGALLETLSTGVGSTANDAGLAQVNGFINDGTDGTVDALYAGDLLGNLWRFDLTAPAGSSGSYPSPLKLAVLTDTNGVAQPVTTAPSLAVDPATRKRFVMVGTGRLLDTTDITSTQQQTFYAIVDGTDARFYTAADLPVGPPPVTFPIARSSLYNNVSSSDTVSFDASKQDGWYEDLGSASGVSGTGTGWRVVAGATTLSGAVAFASTRPDISNVCTPGGDSRLYGRAFGSTSSVLTNPNPAATGLATLPFIAVSGQVTDTRFLGVNGTAGLYFGTSGQPVQAPTTPLPGQNLRRLNWRELQIVD